jgi:molybdate transport system regulatory protein
MKPEFNLWLEANGEVTFSIWRVNLLRAIAETGSISGAAAKLGVQYRTAWQKIHEMETRLGVKLVITQTGGEQGGGAKLTPIALEYVDRFVRFSEDVERAVHAAYQAHF